MDDTTKKMLISVRLPNKLMALIHIIPYKTSFPFSASQVAVFVIPHLNSVLGR